MWQKAFLVFLTISALSKSQVIEDEDYDDDPELDELNLGKEFGIETDQDFQNELLDNLIRSSIENYPDTVDILEPGLPISDRPILMTAKSGVFRDVHSMKRVSPVEFQELDEMNAYIAASLTFETFKVTYGNFAFTLHDFKASGKLEVKVGENELYIKITGGEEGDKCFVNAEKLDITKLKKFKMVYYSNSEQEKSGKCDKNMSVFRSFFSRIFINNIKPIFIQRISDMMNGFVKVIQGYVCEDE